jgi:23S rRNA (guanine745-N1)-methyltransferase
VDCSGILSCPVCGEALVREARTFRCARGHAFDQAREGHVDLLPHGHGRSRRHGDPLEMVQARRRFLQRGVYSALSGALNRLALAELDRDQVGPGQRAAVLDAGCGVGYFLGRLAEELASRSAPADVCLLGFDLSAAAIRMAARTYPQPLFFVGDVKHRICVADGSIRLLLNILAPRNPAEFRRVLAPGGLMLVIIPGENHLAELRSELPLLSLQSDKRDRILHALGPGWKPTGESLVEDRRELDGGAILDLLHMTPNHWHLPAPLWSTVAEWPATAISFQFELLQFRKPGAAD